MPSVSLPPLDTPYSLSDGDVRQFRDNGWVLLREVCSPEEAAAHGEVIKEVAMAHSRESRPMEERDTYGKAFLQITNLWRLDPRVAQFTLARRFAGIAAGLIGVDRVRLYHDQALFKEPGGGHTPWHQDGHYWPVEQSRTVTMWMPLVDISADMGSMSFADGSNRELVELGGAISDQSEAFFEGYVLGRKLPVSTSGAMKAGDATFHSGVTLHKAPGNSTDRVRAVMTVIYVADGERVKTPANINQQNDLESWFPGLKPGDLIGSELNPLL